MSEQHSDDHEHSGDLTKSFLLAQICVAIVMLFTVSSIALGAYIFINKRKKTINYSSVSRFILIIGRLNCFTAGVFVSIGFMDLFTEVQENIREAGESIPSVLEFPIASFFALFGFFLILTVEQVILAHHHHEHSHDHNERIHHHHHHGHSHSHSHNPSQSLPLETSSTANPASASDIKRNPVYGSTEDETISEAAEEVVHLIHSHFGDLPTYSHLRTILLVLAISIHAVFEGFALGLSRDINTFINILIALILHKGVEAIAIGMNLAMTNLSHKLKIIICILASSATPLGASIGVAMLWSTGETHLSATTLVATACLQSIACGTFFYIVFFEILPQEFTLTDTDRLPKLLSLFIGFSMVCIYLLVLPHHHSHEH